MPNVPSKQPNGHIEAEEGQRQEPPEILHITDRYIPLSHITTALSRAAHAELLNLQNSLTELTDQKRKRKIIEYASQFRQEFAKVLVLESWAENVQEVSRAIDVRAWLQGQKNCFDNLTRIFQNQLIHDIQRAQIKAPDFDTAIQVLGGDVAHQNLTGLLNDKEKPALAAIEIAAALKELDVLINLRLSMYETLPTVFNYYDVTAGRVTFHVDNEFDASFFFAVEDIDGTNLQWFMIDFDFNFTNVITPMPLKLEIEAISNNTLEAARHSLKPQLVEVYNFLHRFTIQYKLERLFDDFSRIGTVKSGKLDIKYASAQRVLAIGLWSQRSKATRALLHTFTITVIAEETSNLDRLLADRRRTADFDRSRLIATVRSGEVEITVLDVKSDASILLQEIETILAQHRLQSLSDALQLGSIMNDKLTIQLSKEDELQLFIDPRNGVYRARIRHSSGYSTAIALQKELHQASDFEIAASSIRAWIDARQRTLLLKTAERSGWHNVALSKSAIVNGDKHNLPSSSVEKCFFFTRRSESWWNTSSASWALVVSKEEQLALFLAELTADMATSTYHITWTTPLSLHVTHLQDFDNSIFSRCWHFATARIIALQLTRSLDKHRIEWRQSLSQSSAWDNIQVPAIKFRAQDISTHPWTGPFVTIEFIDICKSREGGLIASFSAQKVLSEQFDLSSVNDAMVIADPVTSDFQLNFVGLVVQQPDSLFEQFLAKWSLIEITAHTIHEATTCSIPLELEHYGLDYARFTYANRKCAIQINQEFLPTFSITVSLGTTTRRMNPHHRVLQHLNELAAKYKNNMKVLFEALLFTYNVLDTLAILEQENYENPEFYIIVRSLVEYRIYYPLKQVALLIRATSAPSPDKLPETYRNLGLEKNVIWHFTDSSQSLKSAIKGQLKIHSCVHIFQEGLNEKFNTQRTFPEGSGIGCTPDLTPLVLREIHTNIMK